MILKESNHKMYFQFDDYYFFVHYDNSEYGLLAELVRTLENDKRFNKCDI